MTSAKRSDPCMQCIAAEPAIACNRNPCSTIKPREHKPEWLDPGSGRWLADAEKIADWKQADITNAKSEPHPPLTQGHTSDRRGGQSKPGSMQKMHGFKSCLRFKAVGLTADCSNRRQDGAWLSQASTGA